MLDDLGLKIQLECIRIIDSVEPGQTKATIRGQDPFFAGILSALLDNQYSTLIVSSMRINTKQTNRRKLYLSWHKPTRNAKLSFRDHSTADRVADRFQRGIYKCFDQTLHPTRPKKALTQRDRDGFLCDDAAWSITFNDVPREATSEDIENAIDVPFDRPLLVEVGTLGFRVPDVEASVAVRSELEKYGQLQSFRLTETSQGKRVKAVAWFQEDADARSACALNGQPLDVLEQGKLTVTLVSSITIKVPSAIYQASKSAIETKSKEWRLRHVILQSFPDSLRRFVTLKMEGGSVKDVADANSALGKLLSGVVISDGKSPIWIPSLDSNRALYNDLKSMAMGFDVVIVRDKSKRQLRFHGPLEKYEQTLQNTNKILRQHSSQKRFQVGLTPRQYSWAIHGGLSILRRTFKEDLAQVNIWSKELTFDGTEEQYDLCLGTMNGKCSIDMSLLSSTPARDEVHCPICFCKPDDPIQTSCEHTYCLECLEDYCKSAASSSKGDFQIKCQGRQGSSPRIFSLRELQDRISSSTFEAMLQFSFVEYVRRHPDSLHHCPTPDCDYVYRCTSTSTLTKPPAFTCPNCLEPVCTSCHVHHGDCTCAEHQENASSAALEQLKIELNIKDCPKCKTPIEKTDGCNHIECPGCRKHICWVCMEVFEESGMCYKHMLEVHGGIGLDYVEYYSDDNSDDGDADDEDDDVLIIV